LSRALVDEVVIAANARIAKSIYGESRAWVAVPSAMRVTSHPSSASGHSTSFLRRWIVPAAVAATLVGGRADAAGHKLQPVGPGRWCAPGNELCVRGALDASSHHMTGQVTIETRLGDWTLEDAALTVDMEQPSLSGRASVALPQLGMLSRAVATRATAQIHIGFGDDAELPLDRFPFQLDRNRFYVAVAFEGAAHIALAGTTVFETRQGTSLVFDPTGPTFYAEGMIASALTGVLGLPGIDKLGFSLDDHACISRTSDNPLLDRIGGKAERRALCGNLLVSGSFSYRIFTGNGTLLIDLDANGDGRTVFEGQPRDFAILADTEGEVTIPKVQLPLKLTRASYLYEAGVGAAGRLSVSTSAGTAVAAEGMPLAKYFYGPTLRTWIVLDDTGQTMQLAADETVIGGWKLADARGDITIDRSGASYSTAGKLAVPDAGSVVVRGAMDTSGAFSLTATEDLKLRDVTLQRASIALSRDGVAISGAAQVHGPRLQIDASVATRRDPSTDGSAEAVSPAQFALAGTSAITLGDQKLTEGRVIATPGKLRITGGLKFASARFALDGEVSAGGFDLTSSVKASASRKIDFGIKKVRVGADGKAKLHLSDSEFSVKFDGDIDPGGHEVMTIRGDGQICPMIGVKIAGEKIGKKVCLDLF
jgi:hypothetical protein